MCGFAGYIESPHAHHEVASDVLIRMTRKLTHRGPDSEGYFTDERAAFGFRRLSIIDLEGGDQPIYNEDESVVLMCNGEIFNYLELRADLVKKGHCFRTGSDVEVLVHLYEDEGENFLNRLNGQFSFVIYDRKKRRALLARDQFGITPLFYCSRGGLFLFASEIKALLEHPLVPREVDLTGLDQLLSFPGLVSPRTMFKGVESLKGGHFIIVDDSGARVEEYWDLDYPKDGELAYDEPESFYVETLKELFTQSVRYRLQADVPVGFYLSGGLDSSMIAAMISRISPGVSRHSFSIGFTQKEICESKYRKIMVENISCQHHEIIFDWSAIADRMWEMIYHCECPVKETYNTCSLALSQAAKDSGISVILTGEGADELFAGYVGYRFDQFGVRGAVLGGLDAILEEEMRERLWGDKDLFYETDQHVLREVKTALYSSDLNNLFDEFDCLNFDLVNKDRVKGRNFIHQRSYLDFKLRLSDHLIADHGDRMALANAVEARYPFLDINLIEFSKRIPPNLKLKNYTEKYILRKVAEGLIPKTIIDREKFGFHAPGSPYLLQQKIEWVEDLLSHDKIKKQGYFSPQVVENLKRKYSQPGFRLNLPFESDLLIVVITFGIFKDVFNLPNLN
jgi:asparagine synthase (glutamine-hydrolysing)